jgi:hypothetical protein
MAWGKLKRHHDVTPDPASALSPVAHVEPGYITSVPERIENLNISGAF